MNRLRAFAPEFIPKIFLKSSEDKDIDSVVIANSDISSQSLRNNGKPKKTKDERACKRKRKKKSTGQDDTLPKFAITQSINSLDHESIDSGSSCSTDNNSVTSDTSSSTCNSSIIGKSNSNTVQIRITSQEQIEEWNRWFNQFIINSPHRHKKSAVNAALSTKPSDETELSGNANNSQWLSMQQKWLTSKQILDSDDFEHEKIERKRWSRWAVHAAEIERQRRIKLLQEIDEEEDRERKARCLWAIVAIEQERNERVYHQFLMSLTSTQWFNETISPSNLSDYELTCPYFKLGCDWIGLRSHLANHLESCVFALEYKAPIDVSYEMDEVVCPNTVIGCTYTGSRVEITNHLLVCSFNGLSRKEEEEERKKIKNYVIFECEEERSRRVTSNKSNPASKNNRNSLTVKNNSNEDKESSDSKQCEVSVSPTSSYGAPAGALHNLLQSQMQAVMSQLHDQILDMNVFTLLFQSKRRAIFGQIIDRLNTYVTSLWPFACVNVYGSYATGLQGVHSDIDIVICFSDEYQSLSKVSGTVPLLHILADYLKHEAKDFIQINTVLLKARVPVIKAVVSIKSEATFQYLENTTISLDISIDSPVHSGLATSEMVKTLISAIPILQPIVIVLKEFLRSKNLSSTYSGGLSSYGIFLLSLIPMLKRLPLPVPSHEYVKAVSSYVIEHDDCRNIDEAISALNASLFCHETNTTARKNDDGISQSNNHPTNSYDSQESIKPLSNTQEVIAELQNSSVDTAPSSKANYTVDPSNSYQPTNRRPHLFQSLKNLRSKHQRSNSYTSSTGTNYYNVNKTTKNASNSYGNSNQSSNWSINNLFRKPSSSSSSSPANVPSINNFKHDNALNLEHSSILSKKECYLERNTKQPAVYHWTNVTNQKAYGRQVALKLLCLPDEATLHSRLNQHSSQINADNFVSLENHFSKEVSNRSASVTSIPLSPMVVPSTSPTLSNISLSDSLASVNLNNRESAPSSAKSLNQKISITAPQPNIPSASTSIPCLIPCKTPILGEIFEEILKEYGDEMIIGLHGYSVRNGGFRFDVIGKSV